MFIVLCFVQYTCSNDKNSALLPTKITCSQLKYPLILLRELTHAPWTVATRLNSSTFGWWRELDHATLVDGLCTKNTFFWTVVTYSNLILLVFFTSFYTFFIVFSVVKTYLRHSPYKYLSNLHHFSHHHLTLSPLHSLLLFLLQQQCFSILCLSQKDSSLKISRIV